MWDAQRPLQQQRTVHGVSSSWLQGHLTNRLTKVQHTFLLNVIISESMPTLKLLASKDQALLVGGDAFLFLNLDLDMVGV